MKKIIKMSYFPILSLVFCLVFVNSTQASQLKGKCYLLFEDVGGNSFLTESLDSISCNSYYFSSLGDFYYTSVKKFTEGSDGYKRINNYVNYYFIPIKILPDIKTLRKKFADEFKEKYSGT